MAKLWKKLLVGCLVICTALCFSVFVVACSEDSSDDKNQVQTDDDSGNNADDDSEASAVEDDGEESEPVVPPAVETDAVNVEGSEINIEVTFTNTVEIIWDVSEVESGAYKLELADETQEEAVLKTYGFYVQIDGGDWTYAVSPTMGFVGTGINLTDDCQAVTIIIEAPESVTGEVTLSVTISVNENAH